MKQWTVTYREKSGSKTSVIIEAEDRAGVFAELKNRGINAISIKEGENKVARKIANTSGGFRLGGLAVGVVLCAILGGVVFFLDKFNGGEESIEEVKKPKKERTASKKNLVSNSVSSVVPKMVQPIKEEKVEDQKPKYDPNFQANYPKKPGHLPLPDGTVVTFLPPKPGNTKTVYTVGGVYICDSDGNFSRYEAPKLFDNRFENTIESLATDGQLLLTDRTIDFTKEEIDKYLHAQVFINEDDTPEIIDRKVATATMKEDIIAFIKEGGTYQEYVRQLHHQIGTERSLHREAVRELVSLLSEGDIEGARQCRDAMNQFLGEKGYRGVKLPDTWQKKLDGIEDDE